MDGWFFEEERVFGHLRARTTASTCTRARGRWSVRATASRRHRAAKLLFDDRVGDLASTCRAPTSARRVSPAEKRTPCPYKGEATYWPAARHPPGRRLGATRRRCPRRSRSALHLYSTAKASRSRWTSRRSASRWPARPRWSVSRRRSVPGLGLGRVLGEDAVERAPGLGEHLARLGPPDGRVAGRRAICMTADADLAPRCLERSSNMPSPTLSADGRPTAP